MQIRQNSKTIKSFRYAKMNFHNKYVNYISSYLLIHLLTYACTDLNIENKTKKTPDNFLVNPSGFRLIYQM